MQKKIYTLFFGLFICSFGIQAQPKYWIFLKDKPTKGYNYRECLSPAAIEKRMCMNIPLEQYTDIPVNNAYIQAITKQKIHIEVSSKWLNAVSAKITNEQLLWLQQQDFILSVIPIKSTSKTLTTNSSQPKVKVDIKSYDMAISQMEPEAFKAAQLDGTGVIVGVIDAGFFGANTNESLLHLFENNRILGVKDWVSPEKTKHYEEAATFSDWHGTQVLEMIAGYDDADKLQTGFAHNASFYLARTDDGNHEFRGEEDYWIGAMEWMDSLGTRIINTSLGYALDFDDPLENYTPEQMDGSTSAISKAASIAVKEKGLLLIVSAGNEGLNSKWKIVSAPADSKEVVSVGATNRSGIKAGYSSIGPMALPYLKPDVSCFSNDGTSFSAPVITGFVACLMQLNMKASSSEIIDALQRSAMLYPYGNNYIGYGIPQSSRAINLMNKKTVPSLMIEKRAIGRKKITLRDLAVDKGQIVVFHKKDEREVIKNQTGRWSKGTIRLRRLDGASRTTILLDNQIGYEIIWKE